MKKFLFVLMSLFVFQTICYAKDIIEFDFPNDSNYDDVDFDNYKIIINEAYNYNW